MSFYNQLVLGYEQFTNENDISLLELNTSIIFNDYVQLIAIPNQGENIAVNTTCVITGLGRLLSGKFLIFSKCFYLYY